MQAPSTVRPPLSWSSVAHSSARYSGFLVEVTRHAVPSLAREVRCEIADSRLSGSNRGLENRLSPTQTEPKPRCSASSARSSRSLSV